MSNTLFGYLASRFSSSPENLATEALNYLLNQSPQAGLRLVKVINQTFKTSIPEALNFSTQAGDDTGTIPDMIGKDIEGQECLLFEVKFWAGLTDNQPVNYLKRLSANTQAGLVFICPELRIHTLWPELVRRVKEAGFSFNVEEKIENNAPFARVSERHLLAVISWREILNIIQAELERTSDQDHLSDLKQLRGLCERMNQEAFLPLRSEELAGNIGKRMMQYNSLVDQVIDRLTAEKLISLKGLRATPNREGYRRYFKLKKHAGCLEVNYDNWSRYQETPIWFLIVKIPDKGYWTYAPEAHEALRSLELENPPRLYRKGDNLIVPVYLPFNHEEQEVVQAIYDQFLEILSMLPEPAANE